LKNNFEKLKGKVDGESNLCTESSCEINIAIDSPIKPLLNSTGTFNNQFTYIKESKSKEILLESSEEIIETAYQEEEEKVESREEYVKKCCPNGEWMKWIPER